ncbi:alpha/beta hydrolase [Azospirillum sp. sgz302134]
MDRSHASLKVEDREVRLRLFRPAVDGPLPGVLYFHGGGFTTGSLDEAEVPAAALAEGIPALVVAVGYALAPTHPFPAAVEDAHAAARWLADQVSALGVAGHDAGGHVAASLTFLARDRGGPDIAAQALLGPMLDPSLTRAGDERALGSDVTVAECARCYRAYLPEAALRLHPYAAPLESRRLGRLPPILIATAQKDVLRPEAENYAARLIDAGVPTEVTRFAGVSHAALARHPPALAAVSDFFRRRLSGARSLHPSHR